MRPKLERGNSSEVALNDLKGLNSGGGRDFSNRHRTRVRKIVFDKS